MAFTKTAKELGGFDILVNNAGVLVVGPVDAFSLADFDPTLAVNIRAVSALVLLVPWMRRSVVEKGARIAAE